MNNLRALGVASIAMVLLAGCAANDLMVKRQTEAETKLEHLYQVTGGLEARYNELSGRLMTLEEQEAQRGKLFQELQASLRELKESNQALESKLQHAPVAASPKIEVVNPEPNQKVKDGGPPQSYVKAFGLYSTNSFSEAVAAFQAFVKEQPKSEYVPNAHYWIGECYYSMSDLQQALPAFQKVLDSWPRHPKAADALLKIGYSRAALKQQDKAKAAFEQLIRNYPGSPAALKARERLNNWPLPSTEMR